MIHWMSRRHFRLQEELWAYPRSEWHGVSLHLQHRQLLSFYMEELTSRVRLLNITILLWRGELFPFSATSISAFCGEPRTHLVCVANKHETANCCFECIASDDWCLDHIVFYLICFLFISIFHHCVHLFSSMSPVVLAVHLAFWTLKGSFQTWSQSFPPWWWPRPT